MTALAVQPLPARATQPLREALAPALRSGALPLAARSAILCAACLWVGLVTLELVADNHERALALHERQRDLVAREAINQRLAFLAESHVPGVGTQELPAAIEGVRAAGRARAKPGSVAHQALGKAAAAAPQATRPKSTTGPRSPAKSSARPDARSDAKAAPKAAPKSSASGGAKSKPAGGAAKPQQPSGQPQRGRSGVL
jgi:hypothetical protein